VIEELEFDRARGKIVAKKAFAYHSPSYNWRAVPSRKKIDWEKVQAALTTTCPKCGYEITPAEIVRVS